MNSRARDVSSAADVLRQMQQNSSTAEGPMSDYAVVTLVKKAQEAHKSLRDAMYSSEGGDISLATALIDIANVLLAALSRATGKAELELIDEAVAALNQPPLSSQELTQIREAERNG